MVTWQQSYLRALGIKPTPEAVSRLDQWQRFEGGHTNNSAQYNYLNTKLAMPGSYDAIGNGVQGYRNLGQGALAFARTLKGRSDYAPLVEWLRSGQGDPSGALQVWVGGPGAVGTAQAQTYAAKILGHPGATISSAAQGGGKPSQAAPGDTAAPGPALGSVRQQAAEGFAAIAQGKAKPEDTFSTLIATIKAAAPQPGVPARPQVDVTPGLKGVERQAANLVQKYLGVNYVWGGTTPAGFDCSGLIQYVYRSLGVHVPRTTYEQWDAGQPVKGDLQPGDAVFFTGSDPKDGKPGHEGMYIGNGLFIEAPHTGAQVRVSKLADRSDYVGARRF